MSINETQSVFDVEIDLEHKIYNPGDLINGELKLICKRKLHCQFLTVKLYGSARVFFTELQKTPESFGQTKAFEQEKVLVEKSYDVWRAPAPNNQTPHRREITLDDITRMANPNAVRLPSSTGTHHRSDEKRRVDDNFTGLETGVHEFKFQFPLPDEGLYTSFDARNSAGYVRYFIIVQAINNGRTVLRRKLLFPVVCPRDLQFDAELAKLAMQPVELEAVKQVAKGEVRVRLELGKRGYVPGEPITGQICINNQSTKSVKYALLRIVQRTICRSIRPEMHVKESYFETAGMGLPTHKLPPGSKFAYPIRFYVPALLPNMVIPECIEADYSIQLEVGFNRGSAKYAFARLKTPIVIGTHPTSVAGKSTGETKERLPAAPPAYFDAVVAGAATDVPPTYTTSVGGLSEVSDTPNYWTSILNGAAVGGGKQTYVPITYHYNFGYQPEEGEVVEKENVK